jgi:hypothetical protein
MILSCLMVKSSIRSRKGYFRSDLGGPWSQKTFNPIKEEPKVIVVGGEVSPGEIPVALRAPSISPGPLQPQTLDRKEKQV